MAESPRVRDEGLVETVGPAGATVVAMFTDPAKPCRPETTRVEEPAAPTTIDSLLLSTARVKSCTLNVRVAETDWEPLLAVTVTKYWPATPLQARPESFE